MAARWLGVANGSGFHAEVSEGRAVAMSKLSADVVRIDGDYDTSVALSKKEAEANGWFVVSDTSWPGYSLPPRDVMSGYGVMTQEICEALEQAPTHVILQGGVGGLAAGVVAGLRQYWGDAAPRVIIVEPYLAACLFESAKSGVATTVAIPESLVAPTVRLLATPLEGDTAIEAGESAIAGLAALIAARADATLSQKLGLDTQSRVLLIGSEGVTDAAIFSMIMEGRDAA